MADNATKRPGGARRFPAENSIVWMWFDAICILLAFTAATLLICLHFDHGGQPFLMEHYMVAFLYLVSFLFFLWGFEMYSIVLLGPMQILVTFVLTTLYALAVTMVGFLAIYQTMRHWSLFFLGSLLSLGLLLLWRISLYNFIKNNGPRQKMLVIERKKDDNSRVRKVKYACLTRFDAWYEQVDTDNLDEVRRFIQEKFPQFGVICLMESIPLDARDAFMKAGIQQGKEFFVVPAMYEMTFSKMNLALIDDVFVFHLLTNRLSKVKMLAKRAADILLASAGLLIAGVPMLLIALLVRLTSKGPVIFKQARLTKNKREFTMYKFRSMVAGAEKKTGPVLATKGDPRITKLGKFLRGSRLDELPQLINVLRGDMSVVGPRPERAFFVEQFEKEIENYGERFRVRAGLTSLSHVYGRYSTDVIDRTRFDLLYIRNYSLLLDFKILLLTTRTVFFFSASEGIAPYEIVKEPTKGKNITA